MALVYVLLVAHFVADFICQTDWMALNKSKRWDALALHVGAYSVVLLVFIAFYQGPGQGDWPAILWLAVNAAAHFVQDAITSRINTRLWFLKMTPAGKGWREIESFPDGSGTAAEQMAHWVDDTGTRHWFFVGIGADQLLHYVTLFVTAEWLLR